MSLQTRTEDPTGVTWPESVTELLMDDRITFYIDSTSGVLALGNINFSMSANGGVLVDWITE